MTISKPSKSTSFMKEKSNNFDAAQRMISTGGVLSFDNGKYFIEHPKGGYLLITKTVYNKLAR